MAVNDTVLLQVQGIVHGQQHIHTLHFRFQELTATEQGLIDAWQASCRTSYRTIFHTTDNPVQILRASQVCGSLPLRAPAEEAEIVGNQPGTSADTGEPTPSWLSEVVSVRTALAGRSRRGRFYVGGLREGWINGNNVEAVRRARTQAYADALLATFGTTGTATAYKLAVHSRKLADVPGTQCQDSSALVTGLLVRTPIGSTRSRKPGSGF